MATQEQIDAFLELDRRGYWEDKDQAVVEELRRRFASGKDYIGNIDLSSRPKVKNEDGSISTVRSMSFNENGKEILVPTISDDGRVLEPKEAIDLYRRTGKHLGKFDTVQEANDASKRIHQQQARFYGLQNGTEPAQGDTQQPIRSIPLSEGSRIDVFAPRPSRYDKFISDKGAEVDLRAPRARRFLPDITQGPMRGQSPVEPGYETLSETAGEFTREFLTYPFLGFQPGERIKRGVEELSGIPREQETPFLRRVAYTAPLDVATGGALKPVLQRLGKTALGRALNRPIFGGNPPPPPPPPPSSASQRLREYKSIFEKQTVDEKATEVVEESLQKLVQRKIAATPGVKKEVTVRGFSSYDEVQKAIDSFEDDLVEKGVDITKLAPEKDLHKLPKNWKPMPEVLEKLYSERDAIGASELSQTIGELTTRLKSVGLSEPEIKEVLKSYSITGTSGVEQSLAAKYAQATARRTPQDQSENLAIKLASSRGEAFDEIRDISNKTKIDAIKAVREITDYFGEWKKSQSQLLGLSAPKSKGLPTTAKPLELRGNKSFYLRPVDELTRKEFRLRFGNRQDISSKVPLRPSEARIRGRLFHGTSPESASRILDSGELKLGFPDEATRQRAVSFSQHPDKTMGAVTFEFNKKDLSVSPVKNLEKALKEEEFRSFSPVPTGKIRRVIINLGTEENLDSLSGGELRKFVDKAQAKGLNVDVIKGGYEYNLLRTPRVTGEKAGALNLDYINTTDDVKSLFKDLADEAPKKFKDDVVPVEDMIEAAKDVGINEADILSGGLKPLQEIHPTLIAARQVMVKETEDLFNLQKKFIESNGSKESLQELTAGLQKGMDIIGEVRKVSSEVGRALRSQQVAVGSKEYREQAVRKLGEALEGKKVTEEIARRFATVNAKDPREVALFLREMTPATTADKVFEAWRNFLLSSPLTPVRNTIGNTVALLSREIERPISTVIEAVRAPISKLFRGKRAVPKERFFGELPGDLRSQVTGVWQGLKDARVAFNQELPVLGFDKFQEAARPIAIKGKLGRAIRIPQRVAMASDEPFKSVLYKSELTNLAYRAASKEGLKGPTHTARMAELVASPTKEMKEAAQKVAEHYTYQDPLGPLARLVSQARETVPGMRYIVPFIQVSANIPKFAVKRSPLYLPWIAKRIASGELKGGAISDELAKVAVGTLASIPIFQLVLENRITGGGPLNPGERNVWLKTHQPYSVRIGDKWHQYRGVEPAGTLIGTIADSKEIWERLDKQSLVIALGTSIAKNLTNSTYMSGLRDVIDAVVDPERHGTRFQTRIAGTAIPNIFGAYTRATEPQLFRPKTPGQAIRARIPGIDKSDIPPVLDIWGNPVIREGSVASRLFWPIAKKTIPFDDPASMEVSRLKMSIGSPSHEIVGVELTPEQYLKYAQVSGNIAQLRVNKMVSSKNYQDLPDFVKEDKIKDIFRDARKKVRDVMMATHKDLREKKREAMKRDE